MSGIWIYRCHIMSRKGVHITQSTRALSEYEYAIPEAREFAEELAKEQLRRLEGVTPETPIESDGWHYIKTGDE